MVYNPFSGWRITGSWAAHMSYSLGGEDYPLPYGTPLPAPASGTLHTSGRPLPPAEFQCGWVGTAGRRQILILDTPVRDVVAVVFQHLSVFGTPGWHAEGSSTGLSGASASGRDWGGEVHLHIHCLTASGARRKFTDYFSGSSPAGGNGSLIGDDMPTVNDILKQGVPRDDGSGKQASLEGLVSSWDRNWRDLPERVADVLLRRAVKRAGEQSLGGNTDLAAFLAWWDASRQQDANRWDAVFKRLDAIEKRL